jgi:peptide/nickel transport system ATP-binding protein
VNSRPSLLEVRRLTTDFPTEQGIVRAVDCVSLSVRRAETLGIAGESGSGKSALVRTIVGLVPASAQVTGEVLVDGHLVSSLPKTEKRHLLGRRIGMVLQDPMTSLNPVRKIGHQLTDPMRYHLELSRAEAQSRAVELLEMVRMPQARQRLAQYPHELSGGMRQRVGIAIALSCQPELLIADEATTALDVTVQKEILDLLGSLQADLGMALIVISHDLGVLAGRTDRVHVMYAGRVVEDAQTAVLFRGPRHPYTGALLAAIPRLRDAPHTRLAAIPGQPPDPLDQAAGCRFAPRCPHAADHCRAEEPPLEHPEGEVGASAPWQRVRCFFPLASRPAQVVTGSLSRPTPNPARRA